MMLKIHDQYLIFLLLWFPLTCQAQIKFTGDSGHPPDPYQDTIIDQTQYQFYYQFDAVKNPVKKENRKHGMTVLQVGKKYLKFTDVNLIKSDSLTKSVQGQETTTLEHLNNLFGVMDRIEFKNNIFINLQKRQIQYQPTAPFSEFRYRVDAPKFDWEIGSKGKEILGHPAKKARVHYAGRDWIAYFAEDIPMSYGPYVFGGLPGLILELYDTENNFHFTIAGINQKHKPIYKRIEDRIKTVTRQKYRKMQRNFYEHPELYINDWGDAGTIPYNLIEKK